VSLPIFSRIRSRHEPTSFLFHQRSSHLHTDKGYAANGVVAGTHAPSPSASLRCGVICSTWPTWIYALSHSAFTPEWVVVINDDLFMDIHVNFNNKENIFCFFNDDLSNLRPVDLICFNGPMPCLSIPPSFGNLALFDWKFRGRHLWSDWSFRFSSTSHLHCGGVTDFTGCITFGMRSSVTTCTLPSAPFNASFPHCNLSALLKCTISGSLVGSDPGLPKLSSVDKAYGLGKKLYFHKGLFPFGEWDAEFYVPCVFAKPPIKLTRRSLSIDELRECLDIPEHRIRGASFLRLLPEIRVPIKVLSAALHFCFLDFKTGGGDVDLNGSERSHDTKDGNTRITSNKDISTYTKLSDTSLIKLNPWTAQDDEAKQKVDIATKADDASVPIELWNSSLEKMLKTKLSESQTKALEVLREWSVSSIWKRRLTKCFCRWQRCRPCHHKRMNILFDSRTNKGKLWFSCSKCKLANRNKEVVLVGTRYEWRIKGKIAYTKWFNIYYHKHLSSHKDSMESRDAAIDCIQRSVECTAWEWGKGSRPYFWRWGPDYWKEARDGAKVWVKDKLPRFQEKQDIPKDKVKRKLIQAKVGKVRKRGYIKPGKVSSVTSFFAVPKGEDDIRMVYNGTSCGLNDAVFAPWFALPTMDSHLRAVDVGTYMADCDIGEMFLNFMLDVDLREFAGVDLTDLFCEEFSGLTFWERWERLLMGFKPSPYLTTRSMRRIDPFLKGNMDDPENVFRWATVILNLPGDEKYNPAKPRVYKVRKEGGMAGDLFTYIDDLRPTCPSEEECWGASHQVGSRLTWLGIQDAPRKKRRASQRPGAWAGSVIHTDNGMVTVLVSDSKWDKTKRWIGWLNEELTKGDYIDYKELERCRGFLIYVSRTYKPFIPYLRGIHKTIDSWRPFRDTDGWKLTLTEIEAAIEADDAYVGNESKKESAGKKVKAVPRLRGDVRALTVLTESSVPPKVVKRRNKSAMVTYGFGDASGKGFGHALEVEGKLYSEYGTWHNSVESKHSNYKELRNLVNAVINGYEGGLLKNTELFLFTDNFVAECAFYNGGSNTNKELNELVFALWNLQMMGDFSLNVYHVSGTRMIASGIDGLSRGDKLEGIAKGDSMSSFIPIHLSPITRSPELLNWVDSWWDDGWGKLERMEPINWFKDSMKGGNFLWDVPPAAGQVAVEQLCTHIHGRPDTLHIMLIPRLCTSHWRKQLMKVADIILTIKTDETFWGAEMHEPLLTAIYFPLLPSDFKYRPWQLRDTELVGRCKRQVSGMRKRGRSVDWSCLRELSISARKIPSMPDGMARKLLCTKNERPFSSGNFKGV
jgi:hypothetical protein